MNDQLNTRTHISLIPISLISQLSILETVTQWFLIILISAL